MFDWDRAFVNINFNEKVFVLNKNILNIVSNFIPRETLTVDDKDFPLFTKKIKNLIQEKNNVYKSYGNSKSNNNMQYLRRLKLLQEGLHKVSKSNYYSRITYKLTHIQKNTKAYWASLKRFLNNKKVPLIPLPFHGNEYVTDFKSKAELFNSLIADAEVSGCYFSYS